MFSKLKLSLSRINYKLFFALLVLGLAPTVYTTVRVFFLGQLPGEYAFSIAGQLSWVNLLYEILNEAIILHLADKIEQGQDDGFVQDLIQQVHPRELTCDREGIFAR